MEENNVLENLENDNEEYVFCNKCGTKHLATDSFCRNCGNPLRSDAEEDVVRCPQCGSKDISFVTYQASSNFDTGDACCGYLLCGPIGLLFGAKEKTEAKTVRKCKKCGCEF